MNNVINLKDYKTRKKFNTVITSNTVEIPFSFNTAPSEIAHVPMPTQATPSK